MNKKIIRCGMAVICLIVYGVVSASDTVEEQEKKAAEESITFRYVYVASTSASSLNYKRTYDQVQNNTINKEDDILPVTKKIMVSGAGIERVVESETTEAQEEKEDEDRGPEFLNETVIKLTSNQCKYPNCGKVFPAGAELITRGMVSERSKKL